MVADAARHLAPPFAIIATEEGAHACEIACNPLASTSPYLLILMSVYYFISVGLELEH